MGDLDAQIFSPPPRHTQFSLRTLTSSCVNDGRPPLSPELAVFESSVGQTEASASPAAVRYAVSAKSFTPSCSPSPSTTSRNHRSQPHVSNTAQQLFKSSPWQDNTCPYIDSPRVSANNPCSKHYLGSPQANTIDVNLDWLNAVIFKNQELIDCAAERLQAS